MTTDKLPAPDNENLPPVEQMVVQALRLRPEAAQVRLQISNSELSLAGSKSALRPELDLVATARNKDFRATCCARRGSPAISC